MKDNHFIIKVADLLKEGGKSDTITFDHKLPHNLTHLSPEGVSGTLILRSLNTDSLYADLESLSAQMNETCDTCESPYIRDVSVDHYTARFLLGEENKKIEQEQTDEEIFLIDGKNETIDVQDMITQAILLQEPVVKHCPDCEKKITTMPDDTDESEFFESTGNIVFH